MSLLYISLAYTDDDLHKRKHIKSEDYIQIHTHAHTSQINTYNENVLKDVRVNDSNRQRERDKDTRKKKKL